MSYFFSSAAPADSDEEPGEAPEIDQDSSQIKNFAPEFTLFEGMKVINESPEIVRQGLELLRQRLEKTQMKIQKRNDRRVKKGKSPKALLPAEVLQDDKFLLKFLRVMKFDIKRAQVLLEDHWQFKAEVLGIPKKVISVHDLNQAALESQVIALLPGKDRLGRSLILMQPKFIEFSLFQREDLIRVIWFVMERATENEETQKFGVIALSDPLGAGIGNFDRTLVGAMGDSLQHRLPVRVGNILLVNTPSFFSIIFPIMQYLLSEKIRSRLKVIGTDFPQLLETIPKESILVRHGGAMEFEHAQFVNECYNKEPK